MCDLCASSEAPQGRDKRAVKTHHITCLPAHYSFGHQPTDGLRYELKRTILDKEE